MTEEHPAQGVRRPTGRRRVRVQRRILRSAYGECKPLLDWLSHWCSPQTLLRPDDPPIYRRLLLTTLVAGSDLAVQGPRGAVTIESYSTQPEVVGRVIAALFRLHPRPVHVLTSGFQRRRHQDSAAMNFSSGVEALFPNTLVNIVKTKSWQTLLSRIGDHLMTYLLHSLGVFLRLDRDNYMQVWPSV